MLNIKMYQFNDLKKDIQKAVYQKTLNEIVMFQLEVLTMELNNGNITELEYYNILGCSKYYAESTAWFIPSCYYENNTRDINRQVKDDLKNSIFNMDGKFIQYV